MVNNSQWEKKQKKRFLATKYFLQKCQHWIRFSDSSELLTTDLFEQTEFVAPHAKTWKMLDKFIHFLHTFHFYCCCSGQRKSNCGTIFVANFANMIWVDLNCFFRTHNFKFSGLKWVFVVCVQFWSRNWIEPRMPITVHWNIFALIHRIGETEPRG